MTDKQHTLIPWEAIHFDGKDDTASGQIRQVCKDGKIYNIAICRKLEDAEFIVRACNSFDGLLETCRRAELVYNLAIMATPTGPRRNKLTEMNLLRLQALQVAAIKKAQLDT